MKEASLDCEIELMFNKQLMEYQIFIKTPPAESALQKTFLPYKIKNKKFS